MVFVITKISSKQEKDVIICCCRRIGGSNNYFNVRKNNVLRGEEEASELCAGQVVILRPFEDNLARSHCDMQKES